MTAMRSSWGTGFVALILVLACNLTEANLFGMKLSEVFALALFPLMLKRSGVVGTPMVSLIGVYTLFLLLTFIVNASTQFYVPANESSFLKSPYVISVARWIELVIGALLLGSICSFTDKEKIYKLIDGYFFFTIFICVAILLLFVADLLLGSNLVREPDGVRLKGFFVEGGPYGLYCAASIVLAHAFGRRSLSYFAVLGLALLLSQSKAGILLLLLYFSVLAISRVKKVKSLVFASTVALIVGVVGWQLLGERLLGYAEDIQFIELTLNDRSDDNNLVMGRIAALYIVPEMIAQRPVLGIGLGNYSLVRNDVAYRGLFPVVDDWDLTGLGLLTLFAEGGLLGAAMFFAAYWKIVKRVNRRSLVFIACWVPVICFLLGLQIYFIYPWVFLGLCLVQARGSGNLKRA